MHSAFAYDDAVQYALAVRDPEIELQHIDLNIVCAILGALPYFAREVGVQVTWVDVRVIDPGPGRTFYVQTSKGGIHWTVRFDKSVDVLLNEVRNLFQGLSSS